MMPVLDGYEVLDLLSKHIPKDEYLPIIVLTADATIATKRKALALGAKDFLTKPFDNIETMLRVWNLLETRMLYKTLKQLQPKT
jgi:CheY-like chemotaxis protein